MLRQAWNDYRGWAKCARDLQTATGRWNQAALVLVAVAAICGAATTWFPDSPDSPNAWSVRLALAATLASAVGAYFGREILGSGKEGGWIQARATAEGIKSECFRYAARAGAYAGADAMNVFEQRWSGIAKQAIDKGLVRPDDDVPASGDQREPTVPLTTDWYKANRIGGEVDFYTKGRVRNQMMADLLWWVAFVAGLAAVVCGALGAWVSQYFAPWTGAMTTIAASIAAYGLLDRRKYLMTTYAAMQSSLERILARDAESSVSLTDLVASTEDLLESEHRPWLDQMLATKHTATAVATNTPERAG